VRIGRVSALSDPGRRRLKNEDAFVCAPPLFAIADGMGGAQAGEVASRITAAAVQELGRGDASVPELIREANARVWRHSLQDPTAAGMGTTITLALVHEREGTVEIGHVGDSRAYRIRAGALEQLTPDHTLVAELVRSGRLTQEEADIHPQRSVITRAVGTEPDVDVDAFTVDAREGDLYLLCSDGLTDMLRDEEIVELVETAAGDPEQAVPALVGAANRAGGEDNVTVVAFELEAGEPGERPDALEDTVDGLSADPPEAAEGAPEEAAPVRRHGAGPGGRWLALALVAGGLAVAGLLLWWGLAQ
jgi:serine/threonine protein phosphatase PrpC